MGDDVARRWNRHILVFAVTFCVLLLHGVQHVRPLFSLCFFLRRSTLRNHKNGSVATLSPSHRLYPKARVWCDESARLYTRLVWWMRRVSRAGNREHGKIYLNSRNSRKKNKLNKSGECPASDYVCCVCIAEDWPALLWLAAGSCVSRVHLLQFWRWRANVRSIINQN